MNAGSAAVPSAHSARNECAIRLSKSDYGVWGLPIPQAGVWDASPSSTVKKSSTALLQPIS